MHGSQKVITDTSEKFVIELFMHPTHDFMMEIMKYGYLAEVLEPVDLRGKIKNSVLKMFETYTKN